jgi:hypothetical protein
MHAAVVALLILDDGPSQDGHGPSRGSSTNDFCSERVQLLTIQKYRRVPSFFFQQDLRYARGLKQLDHQESTIVFRGSLQSCCYFQLQSIFVQPVFVNVKVLDSKRHQ